MAWIDEARKHVNEPGVVLEIDLNESTEKYSIDILRPTNAAAIKGNILKLSPIENSIGGILKTLEFSKVTIELDDTDNAFRTIIGPNGEGLKNKVVRIKVPFINLSLLTIAKTIFTGRIYSATSLPGLRFEIICEPNLKNVTNKYPDKTVETGDYPNAPAGIPGTLILEPYGPISDNGGADKGAWATIMVSDIVGSEIHLVGRQSGNITVDRVRLNGVEQEEGAAFDYELAYPAIDGYTHTEIQWTGNGAHPILTDIVTCDISFGTREPCEAWKHYLETFCDYINADFDAVSYAIAKAIGVGRGYVMSGVFKEQKQLVSHRDDLCREFEVDIWWEPKDGLVHFNYFSSLAETPVHYYDYKDILEGYTPNRDSTEIVNSQRYGFNWDYEVETFRNFATKQNVDSQEKYGQTYRGDFRGLYFIRNPVVAADVTARLLLLKKDPIILDEFPMPVKAYEDSLSDLIKITHFDGVGPSGYEGVTFQVRKTIYDLDNFTAKLQLLDYSNLLGAACVMGPITLPAKWVDADADERRYCYLCDPTTREFADGSPGKRMYSY